jgi:microsomal epoxide hydrolase
VLNSGEVKPFAIDVPASVLEDLHYRLVHARFPQPLDTFETTNQWAYGTTAAYMKELTDYWLHSYNWAEQQAKLNSFSQFTTGIPQPRHDQEQQLNNASALTR